MRYDSGPGVTVSRVLILASDLPPGLRARICNGIGPARGKGFGSKVVHALSWPFLRLAEAAGLLAVFAEAGDNHDCAYEQGGTWADKLVGDGVFLGENFTATFRSPLWFWPAGLFWSLLFAGLVFTLGWWSFTYRPRPLTLAELLKLHAAT